MRGETVELVRRGDVRTYELPGFERECREYVDAGLTLEEAHALGLVTRSASAILALPELHTADRDETVAMIHRLQDRLLMRPAYRRYLGRVDLSDPLEPAKTVLGHMKRAQDAAARIAADREAGAMQFAWTHATAGHNYTIEGEYGARRISCNCGATLEPLP